MKILFQKSLIIAVGISLFQTASSQEFTSYFTGNNTDTITNPLGGVCLMGGASEDDQAMIWFLQKANGGDVLVLRASGSDGYNDYLYSDLGVDVNSVETIVCNSADASTDTYVLDKIAKAEAIWFAGGDQWDYVSYWRDTEVADLLNEGINERNIVIGGTSAGMAIQGSHYFSAQNGTIGSNAAMANPYAPQMTVDSTPFLENEHLQDVITDTHYDDPDRKGRHIAFLARMVTDEGILAKGIACDEYTAVCIEPDGIAHVFGGYPEYDDNAYFLQANCALTDFAPEVCTGGSPLDWNHSGLACKVYAVKGTAGGLNTFDLNDWQTGNGGSWEHWSVDEGDLVIADGSPADCTNSVQAIVGTKGQVKIYPNPASEYINIEFENTDKSACVLEIIDTHSRTAKTVSNVRNGLCELDTTGLAPGPYSIFLIRDSEKSLLGRFIVK